MFSVINIAAATADQDRPVGDGMFIATTGRILSIDLKTRTIRVRGSDNERTPMFARTKAPVASSGITLPGGFTIHIPRRVDRIPSKTTTSSLGPDEYTVVLTGKTTIQDGADPIRLEDFSAGETISIHGIFSGNTLVASKIAKWSA
jgi:hypothetical protein